MLDFQDLIELAQLRAIYAGIEPTLDSIYRMKCRDYSQKFYTPLHVVINELDPIFVFQQLYEDQYHPSVVKEELEEFIDKLQTIKDPSYSKMSKEEMEELVDAVLQKEIDRAAKKKRPTEETLKDNKKPEVKSSPTKKPKQGGLSFSELEKIDSKAETNKSGF